MSPPRLTHPCAALPRRGSAGFTLIELMTAIFVFSILLTVTAAVFTTVRQAVSLGTAQAEVLNYARAIEQNMRHDLVHRTKDTFMVIKTRDVTLGTGYDMITFFVSTTQTSAQVCDAPVTGQSEQISGWEARINYGHLVNADPEGLDDTQPMNLFGRSQLVMVPSDPIDLPFRTVASFYDDAAGTLNAAPAVRRGYADIITKSGQAVKQDLQTRAAGNAVTPAIPLRTLMAAACHRIHGQVTCVSPNYADYTFLNDTQKFRDSWTMTQSVMAPNCNWFRIQFAGDYAIDLNTGRRDGLIDTDPTTNEVIWYGATNDDPSHPPDAAAPKIIKTNVPAVDGDPATPDSEYTAVFGFNVVDTPPPKLIRVTLGLQDAAGRFHAMHLANPKVPDGQFYRFVFQVATDNIQPTH